MIKLTANTRTVVKRNYALITPDSYVGSRIPGWENCDIRVLINPAMGAELSQHLIRINPESRVKSETVESELFLYVIEGNCQVKIDGKDWQLTKGGFVFIPPGQAFEIKGGESELVSFQKIYEPLAGYDLPPVFSGNSKNYPKSLYLDDPQLHMQYLLPDNLSMDMAVNIFTYNPGGHLPFVETHIMEHGLLYLSGQGIYKLDEDWYPVGKGDCIWMAPYCPQWFTAMGKEDAVYIYYKNVNRASIRQ